MTRQARIDYPGALQHVIGRGIDGLNIFKLNEDKEKFINRLKEIHAKSSMQIYAWCIMSNHFHILIQTGVTALSEFMRKLMTGYAVNYNKRHKRKGYLFQNRFKSILCEKERYLLSLIRYIHLNPVKAKIIKFEELKNYKWAGHYEVVGSGEKTLIARVELLGYFGKKVKHAQKEYEKYLEEGIELKEDYEGGGLIRSIGMIQKEMKMKADERQSYDERILGGGSFVEEVLDKIGCMDEGKKILKNLDNVVERLARYYQVKKEEILKSRREAVREARNVLVYLGCEYLGHTATEIGKLLRLKQPATSVARKRGKEIVKRQNLLKKLTKVEF